MNDYHDMFQGIKTGGGAVHLVSVHKMEPFVFKMKGFKWKKVTLESRMENMFADAWITESRVSVGQSMVQYKKFILNIYIITSYNYVKIYILSIEI